MRWNSVSPSTNSIDRQSSSPAGRGKGVQFVYLANVEVADFPCGPGLRTKAKPVPGQGALQGHPPVQLKVGGLVDDSHTAGTNHTHDAESFAEGRSRCKWRSLLPRRCHFSQS